jgi:hypothetical protein
MWVAVRISYWIAADRRIILLTVFRKLVLCARHGVNGHRCVVASSAPGWFVTQEDERRDPNLPGLRGQRDSRNAGGVERGGGFLPYPVRPCGDADAVRLDARPYSWISPPRTL